MPRIQKRECRKCGADFVNGDDATRDFCPECETETVLRRGEVVAPEKPAEKLPRWHVKGMRWSETHVIESKVAGITKPNRDGIARSTIVQKLHDRSRLELKREPRNPYDRRAIAVYSRYGQIGYLPADVAAKLAPTVDAGRIRLKAIVTEIRPFIGDDGEEVWFTEINVLILEQRPTVVFSFPRFVGWCLFVKPAGWALAGVKFADSGLRRMSRDDLVFLWTMRAVVVIFIICIILTVAGIL